MRYVTLAPRYRLRGWRDMRCGLLDLERVSEDKLKVVPLTKKQQETVELLTAPGVSIDDPLIPPLMARAGQKLLEQGFLQECAREEGLSPEQAYRYADTNLAQALVWGITGNCNLRCRHCYISGGDGAYGEPTMAQCEDIVRQMKDANIYMVSLTGGEPFVRRDFWEFLDMLNDHGIKVNAIFSNGVLLTDECLAKLEAHRVRPHDFLLSFDGAGTHDWMRGVPGAEKKLVAAIRRLKEAGYGVIVSTVLCRQNLDRLLPTYELLRDLQVDFWRMSEVVNVGEWLKNENTRLDPDELLEAYLQLIRKIKADGMPIPQIHVGGLMCVEHGEYRFGAFGGCGSADKVGELVCEAGKYFPMLLPDGRLLPCMPCCGSSLEAQAPNVLTGEYDICRALVDSPITKCLNCTYSDVFAHESECAACEHRYECGRCPASSLQHGSIYARDTFTCRIVRGGYLERVRRIMESDG